MNKVSKLVLCLLLAAMLVFSGCALNEESETVVGEGTTIADGSTVLAKVGDHEILLQDYEALYNAYVSMYAMYGYDVESDAAMKAEIQYAALDSLIQEQVIIYQTEQNGFTELTAEQQAELDTEIETTLADMDEYFRSQAETEKETDPDLDVDARVIELIEDEAEYYYPGQNLTAEAYSEKIAQSVRDSYCTNLMQQKVFSEVTVDDAAVEEWYRDTAETLAEEYALDPTYYKEDQENFELYGGDPIPYAPEGYSRIMHILIAPETEMSEDYSTKTTELAAYVLQYGELAIAQANGEDHSELLGEILTAYNTLKGELEQMETDYYADSKTAVEAAYARLESGEDFAAVMAECTMDSYFTDYAAIAEKGKLIYEGDPEWSESIHEQFAQLEPGQYSAIFRDEDGYHIIYYAADVASGNVALDEIREAISSMLLYEKQNDEWSSCVAAWLQDGSVVIESETLAELGISYGA
ncbi:MAG: SurA N-terminal domain-containing protein [Clostridia bacterium]|nr:SurA N-terminal domain-containing protein [Clostridia bacterium]